MNGMGSFTGLLLGVCRTAFRSTVAAFFLGDEREGGFVRAVEAPVAQVKLYQPSRHRITFSVHVLATFWFSDVTR